MKGRKPISDAEKRARGTDQPVRMRGDLVGGEVTSAAQIDELCKSSQLSSAMQKRVFKEKCEQLMLLGQLRVTDIDMLVVYAKAMDDYLTAAKLLKKEGMYITLYNTDPDNPLPTKVVINPYKSVMDKSSDVIIKLSAVFGFSPVDRLKLKVEEKKEEGLGELLNSLMK